MGGVYIEGPHHSTVAGKSVGIQEHCWGTIQTTNFIVYAPKRGYDVRE